MYVSIATRHRSIMKLPPPDVTFSWIMEAAAGTSPFCSHRVLSLSLSLSRSMFYSTSVDEDADAMLLSVCYHRDIIDET